jgi:hypothetical protein
LTSGTITIACNDGVGTSFTAAISGDITYHAGGSSNPKFKDPYYTFYATMRYGGRVAPYIKSIIGAQTSPYNQTTDPPGCRRPIGDWNSLPSNYANVWYHLSVHLWP